MSLLQKASIITTPTAYAEDYLYSIKPAQSLGAEIIPDPNFDTDTTSYWNIATTGSTPRATKSYISNEKFMRLTYDLANGAALFKSGAIVSGKSYKVIFRAKGTPNTKFASVGNNGDLGTVISNPTLTTSFQRYEFNITANQTVFRLYLSPSEVNIGDTLDIDNISLKEITDADFDFDRNSTGTRVNEDYLIEDVPYNIVKYSEDYTVSSWPKSNVNVTANAITAPDGTLTADFLVPNTSSSIHKIRQDNPYGSTYHISFYAKQGGYKNLLIWDDYTSVGIGYNLDDNSIFRNQSANNYYIQDRNDGWKFIQLSLSTTNALQSLAFYVYDNSATPQITFSGDGTSGIYLWGVQVVKGDQPKDYLKTTDRLDIPRIDYTNGEPSILLEPQRQNKITYSQDISQWGNARTTDTANQIISPDGLNNGTLVEQQSGQTSAGSIFISVSALSNGTTYTTSIYAKKKDKDYIVAYDANTNRTYFDLDEGYVETLGSGVTAEIISMPNGWYRCVATFTYSLSPTSTNIGWYLGDTDNSTTVTDSGGVYVYGAQFEVGSYPTSLIHTSGSAVTRSADAANNAANSDLISSTEGVLYAEIKALADDLTFRAIALSDGTFDNRVLIRYRNSSDNINVLIEANNVPILNQLYQMIDITNYSKIAFRYKSGDISLYVDGQEVFSSTTTFSSLSLDRLNLDGGTGADDFYANVKSVMVFKEALTDLELEKLTGYNNHELYMNYYNRLSYLGLAEEYNVESDINNYIL